MIILSYNNNDVERIATGRISAKTQVRKDTLPKEESPSKLMDLHTTVLLSRIGYEAVIPPYKYPTNSKTGRYNLSEGNGIVAFGRDLVSIDTLLLELSDPARRSIAALKRDSVALVQNEFGQVDKEVLEESNGKLLQWGI